MELEPIERLLPEPTIDSQPFWDGLNEQRLMIQHCADCGTPRHYPRPVCPKCFSMDHRWSESSGKGKVHSWTICHHAFHPSFKGSLPYVLVTVDLDDGVRMASQLTGAPVAELEAALRVGLPVEVVFERVDENVTLPLFRPVSH